MKNITMKIAFLVLLPVLATALFACAHTQSMATKHPMEVTGFPICSDCHTDGRASLNHTENFNTRHKFYAIQNQQTCTICHKESFCSDCHAHKEELKPSDKYKDSPQFSAPPQFLENTDA